MYSKFKEQIKQVQGIHITPFNDSGEIDWRLLEDNIRFLLDHGIKVIVTGGNTGEFYSLTLDEVKEMTRFVAKLINKRALVIAGIGYDARTAAEMAKHAEEYGIDGLMIHQPVNPIALAEGIADYYQSIAAATKLPILLYVRGQQTGIKTLEQAGKSPNIVGIKFAVNDVLLFTKYVKEIRRDYVWICGLAEKWAPFFAMSGAVGFTSGLVNVAPEKALAMFEFLKNADYHRALQVWHEIEPFEQLRSNRFDGNNVSVVKEAMAQLGVGNRKVRAPIAELSESEKTEVSRILRSWNKI